MERFIRCLQPEVAELCETPGFARLLNDMGLVEEGIYEIILTTVNQDGSHNIAPMGVKRIGLETLELRPFKSSRTYENLRKTPRACMNVINDPGIFFSTAFKQVNKIKFKPPKIDEEMRIIEAEAHIFVKVEDYQNLSDTRASFKCSIDTIEAESGKPIVFSRGRTQAIEAIIHATRIKAFTREGKQDEVEKLIRLFEECKGVVEKVSPQGSIEAKVLNELDGMINRWRCQL